MKTLKEMYENFMIRLFCILRSEKGQGLVEYALILVLVAIVAIAALSLLGKTTNNVLCNVVSTLSSAQ